MTAFTTRHEDGPAGDPDEDAGHGLYWVAIYLVDLVYGGPEEGGWWYQAGTLVIDPAIYQTVGIAPAAFATPEAAQDHAGRMRATLPKVNEGRPDITQTNSVGVYEVRMGRASTLPTHFPAKRPRYE
jgi:hypothetical protein